MPANFKMVMTVSSAFSLFAIALQDYNAQCAETSMIAVFAGYCRKLQVIAVWMIDGS